MRFISIAILALATTVNAQPVTSISFGTTQNSLNASAGGAGTNGTAYAIPSVASVTWQVSFSLAPSAVDIALQGSLDNSSWSSIDSTTSTTGAVKTLTTGVKFIRCIIVAKTGGGNTTCAISASRQTAVSLYTNLFKLGDILDVRSSTAPQTIRVYGTYTSDTVYSRLIFGQQSSNIYRISTEHAGGAPNPSIDINAYAQMRLMINDVPMAIGNSSGLEIRTPFATFGDRIQAVSVSSTQVIAAANGSIYYCDTTGGVVTLTLPTAVGAGNTHFLFTFKRITAGANNCVIDGNAAETIDGAATYPLTAQWSTVTIQSFAGNWYIVSRF